MTQTTTGTVLLFASFSPQTAWHYTTREWGPETLLRGFVQGPHHYVWLLLDDKYPEFFFSGFPIGHPFYDTGRLYKLYQPTYLRDTSVSELLAEVDWLMKCLHVGVRRDKSKTKFWSSKETSELEGLATREDFFEDLPNATIVMSCKSVEVQKSND